MLIPNGRGTVLPGSPVASLPAGKAVISIEAAPGENDGLFDQDGKPAVSENVMAKCVYPDGFVKNHQTSSVTDLFGKVATQLRNRYGVTGEIKVLKLPDEVKAGTTIEVEI
jgi:hypothetical protein